MCMLHPLDCITYAAYGETFYFHWSSSCHEHDRGDKNAALPWKLPHGVCHNSCFKFLHEADKRSLWFLVIQ